MSLKAGVDDILGTLKPGVRIMVENLLELSPVERNRTICHLMSNDLVKFLYICDRLTFLYGRLTEGLDEAETDREKLSKELAEIGSALSLVSGLQEFEEGVLDRDEDVMSAMRKIGHRVRAGDFHTKSPADFHTKSPAYRAITVDEREALAAHCGDLLKAVQQIRQQLANAHRERDHIAKVLSDFRAVRTALLQKDVVALRKRILLGLHEAFQLIEKFHETGGPHVNGEQQTEKYLASKLERISISGYEVTYSFLTEDMDLVALLVGDDPDDVKAESPGYYCLLYSPERFAEFIGDVCTHGRDTKGSKFEITWDPDIDIEINYSCESGEFVITGMADCRVNLDEFRRNLARSAA